MVCIKNLYNQHITIKNIIISMHSYNGLIHVLILITGLYLFGSPVGVTELILIQRYQQVLQIKTIHIHLFIVIIQVIFI